MTDGRERITEIAKLDTRPEVKDFLEIAVQFTPVVKEEDLKPRLKLAHKRDRKRFSLTRIKE